MPLTLLPAHFLAVLEDSGNDDQLTEPRILVMVAILVISLFAVSFPGLSKSIPFLRIPHVVFFVGKHFGTGVILATAFIHLLQDSFEALQKRQVREHYNNIGKHTGLIILASLLTIFLIEYLSTSYVEHLHAEPSLPPTPASSRSSSPRRSKASPPESPPAAVVSTIISVPSPPSSPRGNPERGGLIAAQALNTGTDETTPLLRPTRTQSTPQITAPHVHSHNHPHHTHHAHLPAIVTQETAAAIPIEVLTNSPRILKMRGCTCLIGHACVCSASALSAHTPSPDVSATDRSRSRSKLRVDATAPGSSIVTLAEGDEEGGEDLRRGKGRGKERDVQPRIGRKRQIIGLLVLQLGIMIHSLVIGLTLAITTGADFTSLTTAVIFHQLFEGLSLGIRIAALLSPVTDGDEESLSSGGPESESNVKQGFVSRLITKLKGERGEGWLKCVLAVLFAITTPTGMGLGMIVFSVGVRKEGIALARMYLIQGLMSAISAGMLIYASTVEMIAGDFVFGDVEGHGHLGHGHSHDMPSLGDEESERPSRGKSRSNLPNGTGGLDDNVADNADITIEHAHEHDEASKLDEDRYHHHHHHHHHHHGKFGKKILAVASLLAGVGGMVLIGLGE